MLPSQEQLQVSVQLVVSVYPGAAATLQGAHDGEYD